MFTRSTNITRGSLRCLARRTASTRPTSLPGNRPLSEVDPEMYALIQEEHVRQVSGLELIASENFTSRAVLETLGSVLTNKYAEGLPGARYYGGNEVIDKVERLCQKRALEAYRLDPTVWGVNVQPYSGSTANFAAFTGLLQPNDRFMGLDLPSGGHLTHGFYTATRNVSSSAMYFQSLPYRVNSEGWVDYEGLAKAADVFKPKLIVAGGSAYPRDWDYATYRKVCDSVGAKLMMDMAHTSGLVAAEVQSDPFEYADVVTTTTHKSLRGPRAGLIFYKRETLNGKCSFEQAMNDAVFPACQGGPHEHQIGAIAAQLREVSSPEFKVYAQNVVDNCKALAARLVELGYTLSTGGTDNHLILLNLRAKGLTGSKVEKLCDLVGITLNKNTIAGDKSAMTPGGVRVGTCALTTRGFTTEDFRTVADLLHKTVEIALSVQGDNKSMKLKDFVASCSGLPEVQALRKEVESMAHQFPFPGFEDPYQGFH